MSEYRARSILLIMVLVAQALAPTSVSAKLKIFSRSKSTIHLVELRSSPPDSPIAYERLIINSDSTSDRIVEHEQRPTRFIVKIKGKYKKDFSHGLKEGTALLAGIKLSPENKPRKIELIPRTTVDIAFLPRDSATRFSVTIYDKKRLVNAIRNARDSGDHQALATIRQQATDLNIPFDIYDNAPPSGAEQTPETGDRIADDITVQPVEPTVKPEGVTTEPPPAPSAERQEPVVEPRVPVAEPLGATAEYVISPDFSEGLRKFHTRDFEEAIPYLERHIASNRNDLESIFTCAIAHIEAGSYTKAKVYLEWLSHTKNPDPVVEYYLGQVYLHTDAYARAGACFDLAAHLAPGRFSDIDFYLGFAFHELEQYEDAKAAFKSFLNQDPSNAEFRKRAHQFLDRLDPPTDLSRNSDASATAPPDRDRLRDQDRKEVPGSAGDAHTQSTRSAEIPQKPESATVTPEPVIEAENAEASSETPGDSYIPNLADIPLTGYRRSSTRLGTLANHVVILHFWASWCAPCREEMPSLRRFYEQDYPRLKERGLRLVTVTNDHEDDKLEKFMAEVMTDVPPEFAIYKDPHYVVNEAFGLGGELPHTLVLNGQGHALHTSPGMLDWQNPDFLAMLSSFLD